MYREIPRSRIKNTNQKEVRVATPRSRTFDEKASWMGPLYAQTQPHMEVSPPARDAGGGFLKQSWEGGFLARLEPGIYEVAQGLFLASREEIPRRSLSPGLWRKRDQVKLLSSTEAVSRHHHPGVSAAAPVESQLVSSSSFDCRINT